MCAATPVLVIKVLSPSRDPFDTHQRVSEYKTGQDIARILLIDADAPRVIVHLRGGAGWRDRLHAGPDHRVEFPDMGAALALCDVYDGLEFSHTVDGIRGSRC
jgi:Uma2 family endonuclease